MTDKKKKIIHQIYTVFHSVDKKMHVLFVQMKARLNKLLNADRFIITPMFKKPFLHPFLLALSTVLSLFTANLREIEFMASVRSLVFALFFAWGVYLASWLIFRKWQISAPAASLLILLFFTYGHLQKALLSIPMLGKVAGRSSVMLTVLVGLMAAAIYLLWRNRAKIENINRGFNYFAMIMFIIPLVQIGFATIIQSSGQTETAQTNEIHVAAAASKPDIYYIVLDTYGREDELRDRWGFDNREFIQQLRDRGFYVADCSLSNYPYTSGSIGSTLNMDYIYNIIPEPENSRKLDLVFASLSNNRVRQALESGGYKVVSFDTGYKWVNWKGTDVYYGNPAAYLTDPFLYPFETLLLDTTVLRVLEKHNLLLAKDINAATGFDYVQSHVKKTYAALDNLKKTTRLDGPLFVYTHLLVPHPPYVFNPDGSASWENYFDEHTGEMSENVDKVQGYTNNILFINQQILKVVDTLLQASDADPIIIIQGDHSWTYGNPYPILNAYYFPDQDYQTLYSTISPVNSFRAVFNHFFSADLPLLEDISIEKDVNLPFWRGTVDGQTQWCKDREK